MAYIDAILTRHGAKRRTDLSSLALKGIEYKVGFQLPKDYAGYLESFNGFEGQIGEEYVVLWGFGELESQNKGYAIWENLPDTLGIGSNGAGEVIALEKVSESEYRVVLTPFTDLSAEYHVCIGYSFSDFLRRLDNGREWFPVAES